MATKSNKKRGATKKRPTPQQLPLYRRVGRWFGSVWRGMVHKNQQFLARRPHRSFQLTRRRDYIRTLAIEGYIAFTLSVNRMFRQHWRIFALLAFTYAIIMAIIGVVTTQDTYTLIDSLLKESTDDFFGEGLGKLGQAGIIALSAFVTSPANLQPTQIVYMSITLIFTWLATVWLLREILIGRKPRLRDGLYNSGAPVLSFVCVVAVMIFQLLPIGLVTLAHAVLSAAGVIDNGFANMLFWLAAAVVVALVLYWITSTIIALIVVTLPGMYPLRALKVSGDLVVGRRLRIMYRLLWGALVAIISWAIVTIIVILLDHWLKLLIPAIAGWPIVPYIGVLAVAFAMVWYAMYVYLFYRKVVDDNAKPA